MLFRTAFTGVGLLSIAHAAANAPVVQGDVPGFAYKAEFTSGSAGNTSIRGYVAGMSAIDGTGTVWTVDLSGFDQTEGPFIYHVHQFPVAADGNCTGTGPHLDPQNRTEVPACDSTQQNTCQVGDLAGKHGSINGTTLHTIYHDLYTSTLQGTAAFVGNRSIVIHNGAKVRIACANIIQIAGGCSGPSASGVPPVSSLAASQAGSPTPSAVSGSAGSTTIGAVPSVVISSAVSTALAANTATGAPIATGAAAPGKGRVGWSAMAALAAVGFAAALM